MTSSKDPTAPRIVPTAKRPWYKQKKVILLIVTIILAVLAKLLTATPAGPIVNTVAPLVPAIVEQALPDDDSAAEPQRVFYVEKGWRVDRGPCKDPATAPKVTGEKTYFICDGWEIVWLEPLTDEKRNRQ